MTVYVREAHPTDEWQMKSNVKDDVCYAQPKTLEQRVAIANDFIKRFKFPLPLGVDDMSNAANDAYAAWPERIYIIDESGRIAYRGGMGPFNYKPEEAREWLAARYGAVKHEAPKSLADPVPASTNGAASPAPAATSTPAPSANLLLPKAANYSRGASHASSLLLRPYHIGRQAQLGVMSDCPQYFHSRGVQ